MKFKILEDFTYGEGADALELTEGMVVDAPATTGKAWADAKQAKEYDPAAEKAAAEADAAAKAEQHAELKAVVIEALGETTPTEKDPEGKAVITVGETAEEKLVAHGLAGYESDDAFLLDVVKLGKRGSPTEKMAAWQDAALKVTSAMIEGDDEQGGVLVPADMRGLWMPPALEAGFSIPRAFGVPLKGNRLLMPALVDATHVGSFFGGVKIYRPGENHQKINSKPNLRQIELTLHKMAVMVPVSDELIEDSPISMAAFLNNVVPQAITFQQDWDHLYGTGANMALGATNPANPSLIAVAIEAAQPAATIVYENIVNMWARFKMVKPGSSCWVVGHDCFPELATMALAMGTAGVAVWMPAGGASGLPYSTLVGLPVILSEKTQILGTQGDICLIDWSQYYYAHKPTGIQTQTSIHIWFDYDVTAFRFVLRSDGQPAWATPLTPANGGPTLSPFVVLAGRP